MKHTIPYTVVTETLDSAIANEIDRLEGWIDTVQEIDGIVHDEEIETVRDFIDQLEAIRGVIND